MTTARKNLPNMHPVCEVFPLCSEEELQRLAEDIDQNGQQQPIVYWRNLLIDGRNRYLACQIVGVEPMESEIEEDADPVQYAISQNLHRRHLTTSQRAMCAGAVARLQRGSNRYEGKVDGSKDPSTFEADESAKIQDAANLFQVSPVSVKRAKQVIASGAKEIQDACRLGKLAVTKAAALVKQHESKTEQVSAYRSNGTKRQNKTTPLQKIKASFEKLSERDKQLFAEWISKHA